MNTPSTTAPGTLEMLKAAHAGQPRNPLSDLVTRLGVRPRTAEHK
jgi:hypothetical protein